MRHIYRWIVGIISVVITVYIVHALGLKLSWGLYPFRLTDHVVLDWGLVAFVPVLALVNIVIGSILRLFSAPITCITFGLFGFVINAIVFWIAGSATGAKMTFLSVLVGSILYSVISMPLSRLIEENGRRG